MFLVLYPLRRTLINVQFLEGISYVNFVFGFKNRRNILVPDLVVLKLRQERLLVWRFVVGESRWLLTRQIHFPLFVSGRFRWRYLQLYKFFPLCFRPVFIGSVIIFVLFVAALNIGLVVLQLFLCPPLILYYFLFAIVGLAWAHLKFTVVIALANCRWLIFIVWHYLLLWFHCNIFASEFFYLLFFFVIDLKGL